MKTILLVEDDVNVREPLKAMLQKEGFQILLACNLKEASSLFESNVDLILLDWSLPDGEGLDWLIGKRREGFSKPVIILTARTDVTDRVIGLEFGANDYVTKPFESRELLARIRVQLRSLVRGSAQDILSYGNLKINLSSHEVRFNGQIVHLTPTEFDLLKLLLEKPGQVYTREEIGEIVWGHGTEPETRALDNCILQLRKKLDTDLIQTVRGIGYKIRVDR